MDYSSQGGEMGSTYGKRGVPMKWLAIILIAMLAVVSYVYISHGVTPTTTSSAENIEFGISNETRIIELPLPPSPGPSVTPTPTPNTTGISNASGTIEFVLPSGTGQGPSVTPTTAPSPPDINATIGGDVSIILDELNSLISSI